MRLSRLLLAVAAPVRSRAQAQAVAAHAHAAGRHRDGAAAGAVGAGGAQHARRRALARTTRSTRGCCRSSSCSGDAANLNHGINPITLPDGSTQFIGQAQNQSSLQARLQPGDSAHRRHDLRRLAGQPHRPVRRRRTSQLLPDVAGRRQRCSRICSSRAPSSGTSACSRSTRRVAERGYLEAREDVAGSTADAFFNLYAQQMTLRERVDQRRGERHAVHAQQGTLRGRQDRRERSAQERARAAARPRRGRRRASSRAIAPRRRCAA